MRVLEVSQSAGRSNDNPDVKSPDALCMGRYFRLGSTISPIGADSSGASRRCTSSRSGPQQAAQQNETKPQKQSSPASLEAATADSTLRSLAGNAFEVSCASAACLVGLLLLSSQNRHAKAGPPPKPSNSPHVGSDTGDDDIALLCGKHATM